MTPKQEKALREYLQEAIVPLIEQVLVKKLGQAMLFASDQLMQPKREWVGLTNVQIEAASYHHTESEGFRQGAYWAMEILKEKNHG